MNVVITIVAILVGLVAGASSYAWWNMYLFIPLAVVAAILTGLLVYYLVDLVVKKVVAEASS